jgi:GntR family transcriptional repressor for pyruvate dehydrogenase complex
MEMSRPPKQQQSFWVDKGKTSRISYYILPRGIARARCPEDVKGWLILALGTPLARSSVTRQVIERIWHALMDGELRPGDKLPTENELCEIWQVSRTPIREAIKVLQFMGILEIRRSEGTFVASEPKPAIVNPLVFRLLFTTESVEQWFEFRYEMESLILRMAIANADAVDLSEMERAIDRMAEAGQRQAGPEEMAALDLEFHDLMAAASGNALIRELITEIYVVFSRSLRHSHAHQERGRIAISHHRMLVDAIRKRDVSIAEAALQESLDVWRRSIPDPTLARKESRDHQDDH